MLVTCHAPLKGNPDEKKKHVFFFKCQMSQGQKACSIKSNIAKIGPG